MNSKKRVLFVCIHNSARSQMAEAFLNANGGDLIEAESAGFETKAINPLAISVMDEIDIDIKDNSVDSVFDFFKRGKRYNYVITVCDEASAQKCPIFPGVLYRINWNIPDPSALEGHPEDVLAEARTIRDTIKAEVLKFIELVNTGNVKENLPENWKLS
jgi:arsenate reductase